MNDDKQLKLCIYMCNTGKRLGNVQLSMLRNCKDLRKKIYRREHMRNTYNLIVRKFIFFMVVAAAVGQIK